MYTNIVQGHLLIAVFSGQVSTEDFHIFAEDIEELVQEYAEIFVIAVLQEPAQYPQSIQKFIKIFQTVNPAMQQIKRFYTLHYNPLVSFISTVVGKAIGIHTRLVQAHSLEEMFAIIERDAERYPYLKASMSDWETLKITLRAHKLASV